MWCRGEVVITTAQLHSTESELKFCASSNPACSVSEIRDGENLLQWSRVEIRQNSFRRSTIPQNNSSSSSSSSSLRFSNELYSKALLDSLCLTLKGSNKQGETTQKERKK